MIVYFVDTNLFLQCKDLKQLPWKDISQDRDIHLLVSRPVMEEIDRLKHDGNTRRAKRARKASSFLRKIAVSDSTEEIIRDSSPRVVLSISTYIEKKETKIEILDLARADDRIINEALSYADNNPDKKVKLLTHDTNPLLTAKNCGLEYTVIPDDWLLDPEPDARDKRIIELEKKVKELEKSSPDIDVRVSHNNNQVPNLVLDVTVYEEISEQKLDELAAEAQDRFPMKKSFKDPDPNKYLTPTAMLESMHSIAGIRWKYHPPSKSKIEEYQSEKYPGWIENVKNYFQELPIYLEAPERLVNISFVLTNSGVVPAENAVIEFRALGGILFKPPKSDKDDDIDEATTAPEFPKPPTPPKGKWIKTQ